MQSGSRHATSPYDLLPLEPQDQATAQQNQPAAWFAGTRLIAAQWVTDALNQVAVQADKHVKK